MGGRILVLVLLGLTAIDQQPTRPELEKARADVLAIFDRLLLPTSSVLVKAGGDLQAALNQAQPGDTVLLQAGATFTGNFVLPVKSGTAMITIRSSASNAVLPLPDMRITPAYAAQLPKLVSPNNQPALRTAAAAHHYTLLALELSARSNGEILALGGDRDTQTTLAQVPHDLAIDRVYVHGDPITGSKRGIALHSAATIIRNSYVSDIKANAQDSQALAGWNGPGPYLIANNYLEGAGENLLFGGSDPGIPNNVPTDITITDNDLTKPLAWKTQPQWNVKNLLELKNARKLTISGNRLAYNWSAAQQGWAVLFTPRNQDGRCSWCVVEDVKFIDNTVQHSAAAMQIIGDDDEHVSGRLARVEIIANRFYDIDRKAWTGSADPTTHPILIARGPVDVTLDGNVFTGANWNQGVYFGEGGTKAVRLKVTNNQFPALFYGLVFGANASADNPFGPEGAWTLFVDPVGSLLSGNTKP